ncbi:hypothetical protein LEP1GSC187_0689 [Leptospira santarosai str. ZUN179]|uniref:Uncharacterized protein n=1 Tax=Leptospira santarosai str. ZUN179 TaxID=1049985 RepID=M6UYL1_9LEPT|nr:hypothetical protein LEP1GSC187_0689 [Leptospira santarosai str. ZUN179]
MEFPRFVFIESVNERPPNSLQSLSRILFGLKRFGVKLIVIVDRFPREFISINGGLYEIF